MKKNRNKIIRRIISNSKKKRRDNPLKNDHFKLNIYFSILYYNFYNF